MQSKTKNMKYFLHLGNNRALSLAEIISILPSASRGEFFSKDLFIFEMDDEFDAKTLIGRLGGTVKIGRVEKEGLVLYGREMLDTIKEMLAPGEGKFKFGISNYAKFASPSKDKRLALEIKKHLVESGFSCRWVVSKDTILSSVVVEQNLLKGNGVEIVIAGDYKKAIIGRTLAVQAFKELSARDYGRPSRDDHSGMLPPKLAQIMLNLSKADNKSKILDPFCGSGTILSEALLMGFGYLSGTDKSDKAINDSQDNLAWLKRKFGLADKDVHLEVLDARELSRNFAVASIDAIVTEPYLGPQRGEVDPYKWKKELDQLYSHSLDSFRKLLVKGGRVVMIWPVRVNRDKKVFLTPDTRGFRLPTILPAELKKECGRNFSQRGHLLYGREGQRVWREIVVLEKE
jgi:tRNA (guanine10-N2)-dimethyltransferase